MPSLVIEFNYAVDVQLIQPYGQILICVMLSRLDEGFLVVVAVSDQEHYLIGKVQGVIQNSGDIAALPDDQSGPRGEFLDKGLCLSRRNCRLFS